MQRLSLGSPAGKNSRLSVAADEEAEATDEKAAKAMVRARALNRFARAGRGHHRHRHCTPLGGRRRRWWSGRDGRVQWRVPAAEGGPEAAAAAAAPRAEAGDVAAAVTSAQETRS
ncbi:hypothetical protein ZEAMMB73_Zm00001d035225 [Zea mays]|uniref:Uncharacterized protein n=1 Tax=Zea mays TaxID=4577 RepID=A0A1D6LF27_MAIZE|nr:hypothetical protein ZEAMMB73_Zm00001d035225 [Zea mays]